MVFRVTYITENVIGHIKQNTIYMETKNFDDCRKKSIEQYGKNLVAIRYDHTRFGNNKIS